MPEPEYTLCACMGPMNDEPHCHCTMERLGLPRSEAHKAWVARQEEVIMRVLPHIFGWTMNAGGKDAD